MHRILALFRLEPLERHPGRALATVCLTFAAAYLIAQTAFPRAHNRIIDGDAVQYYAYLRSLVCDSDVDFANDYRLLYPATGRDGSTENVWLTSKTPTGRPPNLMSIGPALLWSPFFLAVYGVLLLVRPLGAAIPLDGVAAPFLLSVGVAGVAYAGIGAYCSYRACRLLFETRSAFWAALTAWLATPAIYYSLVSPTYSHATSMFAVAFFVYAWLKWRDAPTVGRQLCLGLMAGLAALVRWQDVIVIALPFLDLGRAVVDRKLRLPSATVQGGLLAAGLAVGLLPQFFAWHAIYGQFVLMPQGSGFMQWRSPAVLSLLFSMRHGLFSWTPAVLVAIVGLYPLVRRDASVGWSAVIVLAMAVYVGASVIDWWAGEAFGARRFVSYTVFFALGLAGLFSTPFWRDRPSLVRWTAACLIVYNLLFLLQYQLFMRGFRDFAVYPTTVRQVLVDRLVLPWHLLRLWLSR